MDSVPPHLVALLEKLKFENTVLELTRLYEAQQKSTDEPLLENLYKDLIGDENRAPLSGRMPAMIADITASEEPDAALYRAAFEDVDEARSKEAIDKFCSVSTKAMKKSLEKLLGPQKVAELKAASLTHEEEAPEQDGQPPLATKLDAPQHETPEGS